MRQLLLALPLENAIGLYTNTIKQDIQVVASNSYTILQGDSSNLLIPAFIVHLWLPLFAVGATGVQLLYPMSRAVRWAQWFLRQGDRHPLQAIGMVAAVVVFAGTVIGKAIATAS